MGVIGAVIGGVASAAGSIMQGQAQAQEARYQAQIARNNAVIARKNAAYTIEAGVREEEAYRMKGSLIRAAIKARFGASGVEVNTGSPIEIQRGAALIQELDALTIRNNAKREAHNQLVQATNLEAQAGLNEMQAGHAQTAGALGALSSIAGAVGSFSGKWNGWRSPTPYQPATFGPGTTSPLAVPVTGPGAGLSSPFVPTPVPRTSPGAPYLYGSS